MATPDTIYCYYYHGIYNIKGTAQKVSGNLKRASF